jgi:hypothetical protein
MAVSYFFDPRHGQLTSVINSGKLGLILDQEWRALIAGWPALAADHDFDERLLIDNLQMRVGPLLARPMGSRSNNRLARRYHELIQSRECDYYIANGAGLLSRMINEGTDILATTYDIISRIDAVPDPKSGSEQSSDPR